MDPTRLPGSDGDRPASLGLALRDVGADVHRAYRPLLDRSGLIYSELLLLEALWDADGATPDSLAHRTRTPVGIVGLQLDRLVEKGLVERTEDGVWLTAAGFALRRDADDAFASPAVDRARFALQRLRAGLWNDAGLAYDEN